MWNEIKQTSFQFGLGGFSGGVGVTCVYPIDLMKTNIQESRMKLTMSQCARRVIQRSGFRGLFNGLKPQLIGVAPENAIKLAVNDLLKRSFVKYPSFKKYHHQTNIIAGAMAGASQVVVTNPLEIVKIRLQIQAAKSFDVLPRYNRLGAAEIVKGLGVKGLYKGSRACFMRDIPFSAIYFPLYSKLKTVFSQGKNISPVDLFLAGTISGGIAASTTTPFDVIKTRIQAYNSPYKNKAIRNCFKDIVRNEGVASLFKGIVPRTFRSAPQFGITLCMYDLLKTINKR